MGRLERSPLAKVILTDVDRIFIARAKAREIMARIAADTRQSQTTRDNARYSAILLRRDGD